MAQLSKNMDTLWIVTNVLVGSILIFHTIPIITMQMFNYDLGELLKPAGGDNGRG